VQEAVVREVVPHVLITSMTGEVVSPINPLSVTYLTIFSCIWLRLFVFLYMSALGAQIALALKIEKRKRLLQSLITALALSVVTMISVRIFSIVYVIMLPENNGLRALAINRLRLGGDVSICNFGLFDPPFEFMILYINLLSSTLFKVLTIALIAFFTNHLFAKESEIAI